MADSGQKGKGGEREFAALLRSIGFKDARRGQQYQGGGDSPDVVGVEGVHFEVKRAESFAPYTAAKQALDESCGGEIPVVVHRRNGEPWYAFLRLQDVVPFAEILKRKADEHGESDKG